MDGERFADDRAMREAQLIDALQQLGSKDRWLWGRLGHHVLTFSSHFGG